MKIAICFSGSIRDFSTCLPSLKRYVLNNLNADIFLHLWKMDDISKLDSDVDFKWRNDSCTDQYVIDKLNPIKYVIDKYSNEWEEKIINESKIDITKLTDIKLKNYGINACGMYYKIFKCFELVKEHCVSNNMQYDIVIRARLDFIWEDNVLLNDFTNINDDSVYLIKDRYATHSKLYTNDKFFAGSFNVMKKMCNLFNCISIYQSDGMMIEGQTLNENHIKLMNLQVKWIGHTNTYYKCMNRHIIKNNNKYILIDNDQLISQFWYELSYHLLYNNYNIIYLNDQNDKYTNILHLFQNFKIGKINNNNTMCYIGSIINENENISQIIINGQNSHPKDNITYINVTNNISHVNLLDFVISVLLTKKFGKIYNFIKVSQINEIDIGENIIFKYLDHGYYIGKILEYNTRKKTYNIAIDKQIYHNEPRKNFKIIDLVKYCDKLNSDSMPVNS